jgi:GT2 family glycosyltransferase
MSTSVTIVIPTFNRADWLPGAIDSVLAQRRDRLEILVVDDGSTDGTAAVLERYAAQHDASRFRFISQANAGQAAAINRGWAEARGEIVGYLSDDDRLLGGAVDRLIAELDADPAAAVAYPSYHVIDETNQPHDTIRPIEYTPLAALRMHDTIIGPGALIRKAAVEAAGGWDPGFRWMGDLILWLKLATQGHAIRVAEPLAAWRRHPEARTTMASFEHAREHLLVFRLASEMLGESATGSDRAEGLRNACLVAYFFAGPESRTGSEMPVAIDLQRPEVSAVGSGLLFAEMPNRQTDEVAALWRTLAARTTELIELRGGSSRTPLGLEHALGVLGDLDELDPANVSGVGERLLDAAFHCGTAFDPARSRYLLVEPGRLTPEEEEEMLKLALRAFPDDLAAAIASRDRAIAELRAA